jgi:putative transposase
LRKRIREIAETRVRYGYRRIHVLLRREGWKINHKRTYRLYCEEDLQMRSKTPKRRVSAKLREDRRPASAPGEVWAMDFLADQLFNGQRIRVLTIVDNFSKLSATIGVGFSYKGSDVVETLEQAVKAQGCPKRIRLDNGSEFVSRDLDLWAYARGVVLDFSRPGKPTDNAYIEAFNSRLLVSQSGGRKIEDRGLADRVQHRAASHGDRPQDTGRIRRIVRPSMLGLTMPKEPDFSRSFRSKDRGKHTTA